MDPAVSAAFSWCGDTVQYIAFKGYMGRISDPFRSSDLRASTLPSCWLGSRGRNSSVDAQCTYGGGLGAGRSTRPACHYCSNAME
jgi:hypothetical protein